MQERIIQLVTELVAVPTHEREQQAQELIASWLEPLGFDCELQTVEPGRPNLVAHRPGKGGIFLCSHVDVHPPHGHPDPWTVRRDGDSIVGRGVLDAKGQIAAAVAAVETLPDRRVLLAITCDEERGGLGSKNIALPDGPWFANGGIVLEPTAFSICTAQAGHIDVRISVAGTPQHAYARKPPGSPIRAILASLEELDTCRFLADSHPLLGRPRMNIGHMGGGEHPWRAPAQAWVELTLGVVPGSDLDGAVADVEHRLADLKVRWRKDGTSFDFEIVDASVPIEVDADLQIASALADAPGTPLYPGGMPSWTDAGNLLTDHGLPCVVFGAGELAPAHSDNEWVRVPDLVRLAEVLRAVVSS